MPWLVGVTHRLIARAAAHAPERRRDRLREEWLRELSECPSLIGQMWFAISLNVARESWPGERLQVGSAVDGDEEVRHDALGESNEWAFDADYSPVRAKILKDLGNEVQRFYSDPSAGSRYRDLQKPSDLWRNEAELGEELQEYFRRNPLP